MAERGGKLATRRHISGKDNSFEPDELQAVGVGLEGLSALGHPEPFEGRVADHHREVGCCREQLPHDLDARCQVELRNDRGVVRGERQRRQQPLINPADQDRRLGKQTGAMPAQKLRRRRPHRHHQIRLVLRVQRPQILRKRRLRLGLVSPRGLQCRLVKFNRPGQLPGQLLLEGRRDGVPHRKVPPKRFQDQHAFRSLAAALAVSTASHKKDLRPAQPAPIRDGQ